ncbi:LamG domain-containing protein [Planctomycetales bacterium ZRK34]|nr:LamG domain-containing protein [Planctomycetales bacterium ZRK34]
MLRRICSCAVFAASLTLIVTSASAGTAELRALVTAEAGLQHLYSFEGATDIERRQDAQGGVDLSAFAGGTGSTANIVYQSGFDGQATVLKPEALGALDGAGLRSTANVNWADTMTVESIFRADGFSGNQYIVAGPGTGDGGRGYWLYTQPNKVRYAVGNAGGLDAASTDIAALTTGHWYYSATTYTKDGSGNVTINSYLADLSAHQTALTQVVTNDTRAASPYGAAAEIGVGMFSGGNQEFFNGQIDEVAVYNSALSQSSLQAHLDGYYTFSAASSGKVFEDFDTAAETGLHPALEDRGGNYTFSGDVAENTAGRDFVRTRATDYNTVDFIAEVTYTRLDSTGPNIAFFGLGDGVPDAGEFGNPYPALYLETQNLRIEQDAAFGSNDSTVFALTEPGLGTHRLQIIKLGDDITFAVDENYTGGPFVADQSHTLSLSTVAPFLNAANSRIFFGSENAASRTTFDDLVITTIPAPMALPAGLGLIAMMLLRRRK